jgi:hypothetical protein
MYKPLLSFLIPLLIATFSYGQDNQVEQQLDKLLSKEFKSIEPGCEVLVAKEDRLSIKGFRWR